MGVYVGIDPSLTGTAVAAVDDAGRLDVWKLPTKGAEHASAHDTMHRILKIERWLRDRLVTIGDGRELIRIGIEGPSYAPERTGHDHERAGLWHALYRRAAMYADMLVVTPAQRAKYATGKGNAGKDQVLLGVCRRWPQFAGGNDEADAVTIASMVARLDGTPVDGRIPKPCLAALDKLRSTR